MTRKSIFALAFYLSSGFLPLFSFEYRPEVLHHILEQSKEHIDKGQPVAVVFDLDDTLLMATSRQVAILRNFAALSEIKAEFSEECKKLSQITLSKIVWGVPATLKNLGIENERFTRMAEQYWMKNFFTNKYVSADSEIPGASDYVRALEKLGVRIIYVTGRDEPNMKEGTVANLRKRNFPFEGPNVELHLKPRFEDSDIAFKRKVFADIAKRHKVIAAFENEPTNANAYFDYFPDATVVFIDSIHSTQPVEVSDRAQCVKDLMGFYQ